ncbi:MAG: hypothetical protein J6D18_05185, partial [Erysipelotrichaceae bacterium]|nr:hypothetical protein [Erysipelotrichaceae bacterium]
MRQKLWNRWFLLPLLAIIVILIAFFTTSVSAEETTESPLSQEDVVVEEMPSEEVVPEPVIPESQPSEPVQQPQAEEQVLKTQTAPENNVSDFASLKQQIDQAQADTPVSIKITQGFDWTSTIYVNNSKHIELTSDEPVVLLKNGSGYFFSISNGTLLLNGSLVFDINGKGKGFYIGDNANMEINDDVVIKKSSRPAIYMTGYDSEVVMNGGTMTENAGYRGSCVYLYMGTAWSGRNGGSTFIMNDGVMENNNATDGGGAVFIEGGGRFIMNGGVMRNNRSDHGGAVGTFDLWTYIVGKRAYTYRGNAIYTSGNISHPYSEWANYYPAAFIMNNGILENNRGRVGGAVYIASSGCVINGGQIINNYASSQGGGVYVSSVPYVLHISRAIVSGNSAYIGGGMWYCPTGEAKITVTDGTAIYENNASGAGDDFAAVISSYSIWGDRPSTTISDRMLGGGKNVWVRDGAVYR